MNNALKRLLAFIFFFCIILVSDAFAGYTSNKTYTTDGGGTWGSILKLTVSISGSTATFTVSKQSGTFSKSNYVYIRYDNYNGTTAASGSISAGGSSKSLSVNLDAISGFPHSFYGYVSNSDGYAYVGS